MANIRKSFNFREGVSVDDEDFIVRGSLVGIGTSVPSELLDIRGNLKVVGTTTTRELFVVGFATLTELNIAGSAITMNSSGVITAKEFYGNGATLLNLPTSQWQDVDVGLGFTSIYAVGNVGIATRDPRFVFQIGNANLWEAGIPGESGVGINSQGDFITSGIITAFSFVGFGSFLQLIDADNIDLGTLSNDRLPIIDNDKLPINLNISGIITAPNFVGNLTGNVTGIASTATSLTGTPDIIVGLVSAKSIIAEAIQITGPQSQPIPGISTVGGLFNVGVGGTGFTASVNSRVGIGVSQPTKSLQIDSKDTTLVEVASSTFGPALVCVASSVSAGLGNQAGFLRYGSTPGEFDIYNKSSKNLNFLLHLGSAGINTGSFNWVYGQSFANLMSLTYNGRLGIGITNPSNQLHVVGTSTVTSNAFIGGNLNIAGDLIVGTSIIGDPTSALTQNIYSVTGFSTFFNVNILNRLGINSTSPTCAFDGGSAIAVFSGLGIGVTPGEIGQLNRAFVDGNFIVSSNGTIGVGTTAVFSGVGGDNTPASQIDLGGIQVWGRALRVESTDILLNRNGTLGIGSYLPAGAIDARYARLDSSTRAPVYLPNLTTVERTGLNSVVFSSALIYNTNTQTFEFLDGGGAWREIQNSRNINVSGVATATGGFVSSGTTPVQISYATTPNRVVFTVPGVGSTSFRVF